MAVSFGCWILARHKVNSIPKPVLVLLTILFGGAAFVCLAIPSGKFLLLAALSGLLGGFILVKAVRIRKVEPSEKLPPLRLGDFLEWDTKAIVAALAALVAGWLTGAWLISRVNPDLVPSFVMFFVTNGLVPPVIVAIRATTGKMREFFWVVLFLLAPSTLFPIVVFFAFGFPLKLISCMLASSLAGIAAGCLLVRFGKIRPKAR